MQRQLAEAVTRFDTDTDLDAIVLTGAGKNAFCSGQDLHEVAQFNVDNVDDWLDGFADVYDTVLGTEKPVVAALNGVTAGSGYQLALLCDVRVAHPGVRIGQPEVGSGIPSVTGMFLTWQSLGHSRTTEMMLSGRLLSGAEAHAVGLVHDLVEPDQVFPRALERGHDLAMHPKLAFRLTKQRIRAVLRPGLDEAVAAAKLVDREAYASGEPQATARRFLSDETSA